MKLWEFFSAFCVTIFFCALGVLVVADKLTEGQNEYTLIQSWGDEQQSSTTTSSIGKGLMKLIWNCNAYGGLTTVEGSRSFVELRCRILEGENEGTYEVYDYKWKSMNDRFLD